MDRLGRRIAIGNRRGFTLIELLIVVAIIGVLTAIAIPLFAGVQAHARIAKAQADVRVLAYGVSLYTAHMGSLPATLTDLTVISTNGFGQNAGPFVPTIPVPAPGGTPPWSAAYTYFPDTAVGGLATTGAFVVCAAGDGTFANSGGVATSCP